MGTEQWRGVGLRSSAESHVQDCTYGVLKIEKITGRTHRSGRLLDFEVLSTGRKYLPIELWISRFSKQDPEIRGKLTLQSTRGKGDTKLGSISTDSTLVRSSSLPRTYTSRYAQVFQASSYTS